jgi:hypothetical protein
VSIIEYELPEGYTTLTGLAGLDDGGVNQANSTSSVRFAVTALVGEPGTETVDVNLADLGFSGDVKIRNLWEHTDLGTFQGVLSTELAAHASALYSLTPASVPEPGAATLFVGLSAVGGRELQRRACRCKPVRSNARPIHIRRHDSGR